MSATPAENELDLLQHHRDLWVAGERLLVEPYLARYQHGMAALPVLLDLIYNEVLLREEGGERPELGEYLARFPDHTQEIRAQFEVHEALRTSGTCSFALASRNASQETSSEPSGTATAYRSDSSLIATRDQPADGSPMEDTGPVAAKESRPEPLADSPALPGFDILGRLGSGGMGTVFRAYDRRHGRHVALKMMNQVSPARLLRFKQEFRSLLDVAHPNLVTLYELICDGKNWYLTMELLDGVDLLQYVQNGDNPYERLREVLRQLGEGIQALHTAGKLHRDIKPSNVIVTRQGRVVLLDFGLAVEQGSDGRHQSTEEHIVGTAAYMAPEQAACLPISAACDWYSVGVILYQALTGRLPFTGGTLQILLEKQRSEPPPPSSLHEGIPDDLGRLCIDLLRRRPEDRVTGSAVLHRLEGPAIDSGPAREPRGPYPTGIPRESARSASLVGRHDQRRALADALAGVRQGETTFLLLHGTSGAGKTALLQSFLDEHSADPDVLVLPGRCYERESVPYKAFDSLLDVLGRHLGRLPREDFMALLPRDIEPLTRLFPGLRRVDSVTSAPRRAAIADPQELRRRAFSALRELFSRLGDRHILVLAVDDLQWADVDSATLLLDLFRPPDAPILLFVGTYRTEERATSPFLQTLFEAGSIPGGKTTGAPSARDVPLRFHELAVEHLTPREARDLSLFLLEETPFARTSGEASLIDEIVRESGGNPFFIAELVRYLNERALESSEHRDSQAPAAQGEDSVMRAMSLEAMLWSRVRRLPDEARRVLELIAVSGRPMRHGELSQAAGLRDDERVTLAQLHAGRLIRRTGRAGYDEVEAYHDRIREIVAGNLAPDLLRRHHLRLAEVLEGSADVDPETLGTHFLGAGWPERAVDYLILAADKAAQALAFERAAMLYHRVLMLPIDHPAELRKTLLVRRADAMANLGNGADAARTYMDAVGLAPVAEALELQRRAAMQLLFSGHIDEGLATLQAVLAKVGMTLPDSPFRALLSLLRTRLRLRLRGLSYHRREAIEVSRAELARIDTCWSAGAGLSVVDTIRGADFQARGLLLALKAGEPMRIARALCMEAAHVASGGVSHRRATERLLHQADALARTVDDPYVQGMVALARGATSYLELRWRDAQETCDRAEALFRDHCTGTIWELNTSQAFGLWALSHQGKTAELSRRWPMLLDQARERGNLYAVMNLSSYLMSVVRLAADDPLTARADLRATMSQWSRKGYHVQHNDALWADVLIHLYQGAGLGAWQALRNSWPALRRSLLLRVQFVRTSMLFLRARTALAAAVERRSAGRREFRSLLAAAEHDAVRLDREHAPCPTAYALMIRGGLAALRGDQDQTDALLARAASAFDAVNMRLFAAAVRRRHGELLGGSLGQEAIQTADDWMRSERIQCPERMTSLILPRLD